MSILINGMKMPENCGECLLAKLSPTGESLVCNLDLSTVSWEERPFTCLLTELPPHGRLIDADALMELIEHDTPLSSVYEKTTRRYLHNAPTIVEAERKD